MKTTKLDIYDYKVTNFHNGYYHIDIFVDLDESYIIADISSSLTSTDHKAYLEGMYYEVIDMSAGKVAEYRPNALHTREQDDLAPTHRQIQLVCRRIK